MVVIGGIPFASVVVRVDILFPAMVVIGGLFFAVVLLDCGVFFTVDVVDGGLVITVGVVVAVVDGKSRRKTLEFYGKRNNVLI